MFNNFQIFIGIRKANNWEYLENEDNYGTHRWKKLKIGDHHLYPNSNNSISLKTKKFRLTGWYLFGIKHSGNNRRCFGFFKNGIYGNKQGRPMAPLRRRWRVIRIKNSTTPYLHLQNINGILKINELWIVPLLPFDAFRRIVKRIKEVNPYIKSNYFSKKLRLKIWQKYNLLLNSQSNKINAILSYQEWISCFENQKLKSIYKYKSKFDLENKISIQKWDEPELIENGKYCLPKYKNILIANYALKIYSYNFEKFPDTKIFYTDEDNINAIGIRSKPDFKPAWNRELFFTNPSYSKNWLVAAEYWNNAIKLLRKLNIKPTVELIILEVFNQLELEGETINIRHIPIICYHKKIEIKNDNSIFFKKLFANNLLKFLNRNKSIYGNCINVKYFENSNIYKLTWACPKSLKLSILIPIRDKVDLLRNCINSIEKYPTKIDLEIIIIDNNSKEKNTLRFLDKYQSEPNSRIEKKLIKFEGIFNFAKMNNQAFLKSSGDVILFLNNDIKFISRNWAYEISTNAIRPGIGFVGSKLLFEDNTIQHGGVILGIGGIAGHSHKYFDSEDCGFQNRLVLAQEYSALTAACLGISRENWQLLGGFNEKYFKVNYNDVDICLRAREKGLRNIFLPSVLAYHFESKTRGKPVGKDYQNWVREYNNMKKIWGKVLLNDPAYNPNLSLNYEDFSFGIRKKINTVDSRSNSIS